MYIKTNKFTFDNIKNIYIMLDQMNDNSCRYCPLINDIQLAPTDTKIDIVTAIKNIKKKFSHINLIFYGNDIPNYLNLIIRILNELNTRITIITSGELLNNDSIYKINTNNIAVEILLPDKLNENKTYDILEKEREKDLLLKINNLTFHCRLSANNYPYDAYLPISLFDKQYVQIHRSYHSKIYLDILHNNLQSINMIEWRKQILLFIDENKQYKAGVIHNTPASKLIQDCLTVITEHNTNSNIDNNNPQNDFNTDTNNSDSDINRYDVNRYDLTICNNGLYNLNLDLTGKLYFCPNNKYLIGNISDRSNILIQRMGRIDSSYKLHKRLNCYQCNLYNYCTNCFDIPLVEQQVYCQVMKATWEPILEYYNSLSTKEDNS